MKFLLLLLFLVGCATTPSKEHDNGPDGTLPGQRPISFYDPELEQLYDFYKLDAALYGVTIPPHDIVTMRFIDAFPEAHDKDGREIGECDWDQDAKGKFQAIYILNEAWNRDMPYTMRAIVYHELTHCIFYLEHSKITGSIMSSTAVDDEDYWANDWTWHLNALFNYIKGIGP